jgi:hypothetical protein
MATLTKETLRDRLNQTLGVAVEARLANEGYNQAPDAQYPIMLFRLAVANATVLLVNDALDLIGCGPLSKLNQLGTLLGATSVGQIEIDALGQAEVITTPAVDADSPEAMRIAEAYAAIAEVALFRIGHTNAVELHPDPSLVSEVKADLARYAEHYGAATDDVYTRHLREAARKLAKGAHEDLVFIGEEAAPAPTQHIQLGDKQEGGKTVTFHIPIGQPAPAEKKPVGPLTRAGGLAAAVAETDLCRVALHLSATVDLG